MSEGSKNRVATKGWLLLVVVLDVFSRMVVRWSMAAIQDVTLVTQALRMAIARRRQDGWVTRLHGSWEHLHERGLSIALKGASVCFPSFPFGERL